MSAVTEFDVGPLTWVKGEIDQALTQALEKLAAFGANPEDRTLLRQCLAHLHQVTGAIQMVGVDGAGKLSEETERLASALEKGEVEATAANLATVERGAQALSSFLDGIINGEPNQALRLYPAYEALLRARGIKDISPAELFFPDLGLRPPKNLPTVPVPDAEMGRFAAACRAQFQKGMLGFIRNDEAGAVAMQEALNRLEQAQSLPAQRAFWWVAGALLDAIVAKGLSPTPAVKQLCGKIDLQLRRLAEGVPKVAEKLLREVLYYVAVARPVTERIRLVRKTFGLDDLLPPSSEAQAAQLDRETALQPLLRKLHELLAPTKDAWLKATSGNTDALPAFQQCLSRLQHEAKSLGNSSLDILLSVASQAASGLVAQPGRLNESVGMEMATSLLLAGNSLENFFKLTSELQRQVDVQNKRLIAAINGKSVDVEDVPLLDEMSRRAQENLLMAQVSKEILANLNQIEQVLDAFFRESDKRAELAGLDTLLRQVNGALMMLQQDSATELLAFCQELIRRFQVPDYVPDQAELEKVAEGLSSLGFFIEELQRGKTDAARALAPVLARLTGKPLPAAEVAPEAPVAQPTVESTLAASRKEAQRLLEAFKKTPGDAALRDRLMAALRSLIQDAELAGETTLREKTAQALRTVEQLKAAPKPQAPPPPPAPEPPPVAEPAPEPAPAPAAKPFKAPTTLEKVGQVQDRASEDELLDIYLEEAKEVLGTIATHMATLRQNPGDKEAFTVVRRSFHTLKGSGRMVGLNYLGEVAWGCEQVMNKWLSEDRAMTAGLMTLIEESAARFARWVDELVDRREANVYADDLFEMAEQFKAGNEPLTVPVLEGAPADQTGLAGRVTKTEAPEEIAETAAPMTQETMAGEATVAAVEVASQDETAVPIGEVSPAQVETTPFELMAEQATVEHSRPAAEVEAPGVAAEEFDQLSAEVEPAMEKEPTPELEMRQAVEQESTSLEELSPVEFSPAQEIPGKAEEPAASPEPVAEIVIGDAAIPTELFEIFVSEADEHLRTLQADLAIVQEEGGAAGWYGFMRAAHTLCGISRTVGLPVIAELGYPLEMWLKDIHEQPRPVTTAQIDVMARTIRSLSDMVAAVHARRMPALDADLAQELEALLAQALESRRLAVLAPTEDSVPELEPIPSVTSPPDVIPAAAPEVVASISSDIMGGITVRDELDLDLLPVFMEEADDLFPQAGSLLRGWRDQPGDFDTQQILKRVLHTIKGSARMAGALRLGEMTHRLETAVLEAMEGGSVAPATFDQLEIAYDAMSEVLDRLRDPASYLAGRQAAEAEPAPFMELPAAVPESAQEVAAAPAEPVPTAATSEVEDEIDAQLLPLFLEEAQELFPQVSESLHALRGRADDSETQMQLRRALHTIKGSARMAGALRLGEMTHHMESRMLEVMEGGQVTPALLDRLDAEYDGLSAALEGLQKQAAAGAPAPEEAPAVIAPAATRPVQAAAAAQAAPEPVHAVLRMRAEALDRLVNEAGEVNIARSRIDGEVHAMRQALQDLTENIGRLRAQVREIEIQAESQMQARVVHAQEDQAGFDPLEFDRFTRLQELTRFMAESVNDVSTVQQNLLKNAEEVDKALRAQAVMGRELQQELLRVRMVPLASLTERLHRIVRQTTRELGKKARLDMVGGHQEIDRSVLEKMTAPFEHLLRNAISHGLETPEERARSGKAEQGSITIGARQEGNEIVIDFTDDGAGLNLERIRAKAEEKGLVQPGEEVNRGRLMGMIFQPGFSTATQVTQVSGRGVGMDVVRNEIVGLGGRIEIQTQEGHGTTFSIFLPLTLAVTQTVMVKAGAGTYALPATMVVQFAELKQDALAQAYADRALSFKEESYPFYYLPRLLGDQEHTPVPQKYAPVLFLRSGSQHVAIHIDEMLGNQESVVKNIGPQLARVPGIEGATVRGDGGVVLILNPTQLAGREIAPVDEASKQVMEEEVVVAPTIMVVDDSLTVRKITSRLLQREGYNVMLAKDGVDGLEQLQDNLPDVMLVDIEMPRMDGFEFTRNIRGSERTRHIPIIMITSRTADKHRNYAMELGVNVYLGKPYQEDELLGHIAGFVRKPA